MLEAKKTVKKEKIKECVRKISDKEFAKCNGITNNDVNELIRALNWMREDCEDLFIRTYFDFEEYMDEQGNLPF